MATIQQVQGEAGGFTAAWSDGLARPADCVGPVPVPTGGNATRAIAHCAAALAERWSQPDAPLTAQVIQEDGTPVELPARAQTITGPLHGVVPDVIFVVSLTGDRFYAECPAPVGDGPIASCWARSLLRLLTAVAGQAELSVAELDPGGLDLGAVPLVDETDRWHILHGLNEYRRPRRPEQALTASFERQVRRTPEAIALQDESGTLVTYRELNEQANRLAYRLQARGAGPGERVAVFLERSLSQLVAIYAVVKTGACYVPIDADLPDGRIATMLADTACLLVLTDPSCGHRLPSGGWQQIDVVTDAEDWAAAPSTNPDVVRPPQSLLHILFTSGTTGRAKGVAYPAAGAWADLDWMQRRYPFRPGDVTVYKTSPGFDVSIWEIFWPLQHGARLLVCRPGGQRDPRHLAELTERHGVTMISLVPTVAGPFLEAIDGVRAAALRWVLCGGEPMTPHLRDRCHLRLPRATLVNAFGPTEAGRVTDNVLVPEAGCPSVPVGRPSDNFRLTLLDERLDLVPVGKPGEAYISGPIGLALGYWNAPTRTAERFVADPYGEPGSRMYRTGDLCRYRDDGRLEHLGRVDRQVKINGTRIEPGEVESVLTRHAGVADAAVVAYGSPARLIAFLAPATEPPFDPAPLQRHLAETLPAAMRPSELVVVAEIPATVNGKVDREALLDAWSGQPAQPAEQLADAFETEVAALYAEVVGGGPVAMSHTLHDLGGSSVLAFTLLDRCRERFGATPDAALLLTGTVRDVSASLRGDR